MSVPIEIGTPESFDELISAPEGLVVVYFWGPDCPNCEIFARDLPQLATEIPQEGVRIVKVNAYEHPELARRFALFGIPGFVLFKGGKKLGMMRQYNGREYWRSVITEQAHGVTAT
jgi:thiol-disulfide isomerase/thioredoxin